jgi:hypothetical protein
MDICFNCPHCGQHLSVEQRGAGMIVNCPSCQQQIEIPHAAAPQMLVPVHVGGRMKIYLRVLGIFAAIIALLVFFVLVFSKMNKLSEESERSTHQQTNIWQRENQTAIEQRLKGMTTAGVRQAWGEPGKVLRGQTMAGDPAEWWYYHQSRNESLILFFRNGTLQSVTPTFDRW